MTVHDLRAIPIFEHVSSEVLDDLIRASRVRTYPRGQLLCNEGDPGDQLIILESGQLRISRFSATGDDLVLAVIDPPAVVGELALLDGGPRDATVTAQRAVTVRLIPRQVFMELLQRDHGMVQGLLHALVGLVRAGNDRHADVLALDVPGRLAKWLLRRVDAEDSGDLHPGTVVHLQRSQGELAAELGTTRSTLNRALHDFEALGFLAIDGDDVTLLKPGMLRTYAS
jgi:CRP/FNR family cyclic AMP-dependent transcriptional regulator